MPELELTRSQDDRRRYEIAGVGTLRVGGMFSRTVAAEAGGRSWTFNRPGFWRRRFEATDAAGAVVGSFDPRAWGSGGELRWNGHDFEMRPASRWRQRYALADGDRELAVLDGVGWGRRPVRITLEDRPIDPGLVLFAAYVVRGLVDDANAAAAGSTATTSGPS